MRMYREMTNASFRRQAHSLVGAAGGEEPWLQECLLRILAGWGGDQQESIALRLGSAPLEELLLVWMRSNELLHQQHESPEASRGALAYSRLERVSQS